MHACVRVSGGENGILHLFLRAAGWPHTGQCSTVCPCVTDLGFLVAAQVLTMPGTAPRFST